MAKSIRQRNLLEGEERRTCPTADGGSRVSAAVLIVSNSRTTAERIWVFPGESAAPGREILLILICGDGGGAGTAARNLFPSQRGLGSGGCVSNRKWNHPGSPGCGLASFRFTSSGSASRTLDGTACRVSPPDFCLISFDDVTFWSGLHHRVIQPHFP